MITSPLAVAESGITEWVLQAVQMQPLLHIKLSECGRGMYMFVVVAVARQMALGDREDNITLIFSRSGMMRW